MAKSMIHIGPSPRGRGFRLETEQVLRAPRDRVFGFFSDAFQLEALTPNWLHFSVLTPAPIEMRVGTLIDYRLRVHGVPLRWQSRISVWEPPVRFVDEQLRGPYRSWRHEHVFEERGNRTRCSDTVDYAVPGGWFVDRLLIRRDLYKIFDYRQAKLRELFGDDDRLRMSPELLPDAGTTC